LIDGSVYRGKSGKIDMSVDGGNRARYQQVSVRCASGY
jgi:hypothetical protein